MLVLYSDLALEFSRIFERVWNIGLFYFRLLRVWIDRVVSKLQPIVVGVVSLASVVVSCLLYCQELM